MICGLGIDIVEIARIEDLLSRWGERFVARVFTPEEIALCEGRANRAASFAVRFAAKEAFAKALGTGVDKNFSWKDFSIYTRPNGSPEPVLSARLAGRLEGVKVHVSLSHADLYGVAIVILEKHGTIE
jgi:holo-[acyl-carrier protein] synthase